MARRRRTDTAVRSSTQISLGTEYQSPAERRVIDPSALVPTGTQAVPVPEPTTGTQHPVRGCVPVLGGPEAFGVRRRIEREIGVVIGADVLHLPALYWPVLPRCASLLCHADYAELPCCITNSRGVWQALKRRKRVAVGTFEWAELVSSFENDRANPMLFGEWCDAKLHRPTWRFNRRDALGVIGDQLAGPQGALVGDVLRGWGLQLMAVTYDAEVPS